MKVDRSNKSHETGGITKPETIQELAELLGFLGNEQRLKILQAVSSKERFAREISKEIGISRSLVVIYLKQLEKRGFVTAVNRSSDDPPYFKRYYRAVPFVTIISLDLIESL